MNKPTLSTNEAAELMNVGPQYVLDLICALAGAGLVWAMRR